MRSDFLYPKIDMGIKVTDRVLESLGDYFTLGESNHLEKVVFDYVAEMFERVREEPLWKQAYENFDVDNKPWEMSPSQYYIYRELAYNEHPRVEICTSTQIGKTMTVANGILTRITTFSDDFLVVAPDEKRGAKLIQYIIKATSENDYFSEKLTGLNIHEKNLLMRLLEEKSKHKLTYSVMEDNGKSGYGTVEILTASAKFKKQALDSIMGFGGRKVISEESSLIDDEIEAGIFRMIAGKGEDTFYLKIGNPFYRNHFMKTWLDPRYMKIFVNDLIGLAEKRYTEGFLKEAAGRPRYNILFKGSFPQAGVADSKGWMQLMSEEEVRLAMQEGVHFGEERLGADPADEGDNESVIVKRSSGYAEIVFADDSVDPMVFVGNAVNSVKEINSKRLYWDRVGVGSGGYARLREVARTMKPNAMIVTGVNAGEKAGTLEFYNKRAEMYWSVRKWIKDGGKLSKDDRWLQLANIFYKTESSGKVQIMSKIEMRERGIDSPDVADAIALTFYDPVTSATSMTQEDKFFAKKMLQNQKKRRSGYGLTPISR